MKNNLILFIAIFVAGYFAYTGGLFGSLGIPNAPSRIPNRDFQDFLRFIRGSSIDIFQGLPDKVIRDYMQKLTLDEFYYFRDLLTAKESQWTPNQKADFIRLFSKATGHIIPQS